MAEFLEEKYSYFDGVQMIDRELRSVSEPRYEGKSFSLLSWPNIAAFVSAEDEMCSLSLRAKLLYGKHSFDSLLSDNCFGDKRQIIATLAECEKLGLLKIHEPSTDIHEQPTNPSSKKSIKRKNSIYSKLIKWLR